MKVSGKGDFDRVNSAMLGEADGWRTYPPAAKFKAADSVGYSGEKDFEQAVIPMQPGPHTVPATGVQLLQSRSRHDTKPNGPRL